MTDGDGGGGRTLDRQIAVDWEHPPAGAFDVDVVVVYRDGTRETVADDRVEVLPDGLRVEGHPLAADKRVLQVEVEWLGSEGPVEQLADWLRGVREDVREWRRNR